MMLTILRRITRIKKRDSEGIEIPETASLHYKHGNIALGAYKTIYFFIPKVACSSLKIHCARLLGIEKEGRHVQRLPYPAIPRKDLHKYSHYFSYAFVRNPWDRLVSAYCDKILAKVTDGSKDYRNGVFRSWTKYKKFKAGMSFESFVDAICQIPDSNAESHFKSQHCFLTDASGKSLVNFIGKFENIGEDFKKLSECAKFPEMKLGHLLPSKRGLYTDYYTDRTVRMVAKRYKTDIDMYGYIFGS